ncbi:MAG: hypothetical protein ACI9OJ_002911, partial [Myxococcota bacterium]
MRVLRFVLVTMAILSCSETEEPTLLTAPENPGVAESNLTCDAGDRAFVRRAIFDLWGRRPRSIREVDLLADAIAAKGADGRSVVIEGMLRSDEYL